MGGCFLATLYAGYTGLVAHVKGIGRRAQGSKSRGVGARVQEHAGAGASDEEALAPPPPSLVQAASDADAAVAALTEKRSVIQAATSEIGTTRLGTILLAVGIPMALEGPVNTYMRAGKLFPGPHVYAGVGVASLWAIAAALVPEMQKGKGEARTAHIGVNAVTFGLFAYYQIPTGLEIAAKVIEKTKFPLSGIGPVLLLGPTSRPSPTSAPAAVLGSRAPRPWRRRPRPGRRACRRRRLRRRPRPARAGPRRLAPLPRPRRLRTRAGRACRGAGIN